MKKEPQSQNKRGEHTDYDATSHVRDVNGHEIFKSNRLTSQFLMLRYMSVIWHDYKTKQNAIKKDANRRKSFRYPLIIPFVYYEGEDSWTADLHLKDRIEFADEMSKYIPDFRYHVVSVHQYTNEELSEKGDEMALVMLINKIQNPGDWKKFTEEAKEFVNKIYEKAPEEIKEIIQKVLWALLKQMNVPNEEARELMGEIGGRGMGILFEHAEKMDIQAERRNTAREKERADAAEERANAAEAELVELRKKLARLEAEK